MNLIFNFGFMCGLVAWDDTNSSNSLLTSEFYEHMNTIAMVLGLEPEGNMGDAPLAIGYDFCTTNQLIHLKETIMNTRVKL